jgi:hypothetical protein
MTAVEQLIDNLETLLNYKVKGEIEEDKPVFEMFQQALEIEKQQIIDAHLTGLIYPLEMEASVQAEQYYNETYKPEAE